jgi:hypothetical protein
VGRQLKSGHVGAEHVGADQRFGFNRHSASSL